MAASRNKAVTMYLLRRSYVLTLILILAVSALGQNIKPSAVPTPSQFLGFEVGADRTLADYHQIASYFKKLSEVSPRVQVVNLGKTTLGNDLFMAVISSPENLKNLAHYKEIARKLADPRGLTHEQVNALAHEGKAILLVTCNIHSTEIGSSQMAMEWAYGLATATDSATRERLDNVILLLVPSLNPDGEIMVTEWYRKYVGTKYEGGYMPYLYHHYIGHDNNRDWYMLTQKESKAVSDMVYLDWKPQLWLDEHQMGSTGPRIFVAPDADPIGTRMHPMIFSGKNMVGTTMAFRLDEARKAGVIHSYEYDNYWPGATDGTAMFKNIFGMLVEVASARIASPMDVAPTELTAGNKGLTDYQKQSNYPNPWQGGTWRLRDIMDYDRIVSDALLETVSAHKEDYMRGVARMASDGIDSFKTTDYFRIPLDDSQRDPEMATRLAQLMREHGAEVRMSADGKAFYLPLAQPYGKFIEEMLTPQRYPEVRPAPGQPYIYEPYDVTAWTLPLLMGVKVDRIDVSSDEAKTLRMATDADWPKGGVVGRGAVLALRPEQNNATRLVNAALKAKAPVSIATEKFNYEQYEYPAGTFLIDNSPETAKLADTYHLTVSALRSKPGAKTIAMKPLRVGLFKPYLASMDEGWTRFVLDQYGYAPISIENKTMKAGKLNDSFDVIILPDVQKEIIIDGQRKRGDNSMKYVQEFPEEYKGGIGKEGVQALKDFVQNGGTLITIADSGDLVASEFNVPVRNALAGVRGSDFDVPGSLVRVKVDTSSPIGYGMPEETPAFLDNSIVYQTMLPGAEMKRSIVASYPEDGRDILLSGWAKGQDKLARHSAVVTFEQGKGKIVMFSFRPQYRAQSEATFKMLFNAIRWAGM
ncbi:MAG TPA: M14 metallopeptidase family protein [Terriglobales bacterium]